MEVIIRPDAGAAAKLAARLVARQMREKPTCVLGLGHSGHIGCNEPLSALQLHPKCHVIVDEEAASELTQKDYYRWFFENEPEWTDFR